MDKYSIGNVPPRKPLNELVPGDLVYVKSRPPAPNERMQGAVGVIGALVDSSLDALPSGPFVRALDMATGAVWAEGLIPWACLEHENHPDWAAAKVKYDQRREGK